MSCSAQAGLPGMRQTCRGSQREGPTRPGRHCRGRGAEPTPAVDTDRFQDDTEPYPGHWRDNPATWPYLDPSDPDDLAVVQAGLAVLPEHGRARYVATTSRAGQSRRSPPSSASQLRNCVTC